MTPRLDIQDHLATITLQRPEAANKLAPEDLGTLVAHVELINRRDDVRVVVLRSEGKYFLQWL